jgi:mono/diheme cytochrome c family protein
VWPARVNPGINRGYRPEMLRDGKLKEFTAACAFFIYDGDLLPEFAGNSFVAEPSANFVRRNVLTWTNGTPRGVNAYANEKTEFIASTDERFRPVNFATGPDGALYIVDFYRGVLQHRISLTSYLRQQSEERKLANPRHLGRIYRVVPADRPAPRATQMAALANAQWVEKLSSPNGWWRATAQRLLVERRDATVAPLLRRLATSDAATVDGRVRALWTLEGIGALDRATVVGAMGAREPAVRSAAIRLSERFLAEPRREEIIARWLELARDGSAPEVQLQAVLSLGEARDPATDFAAAEIVHANRKNIFLSDALYSGLTDRELTLLNRLIAEKSWSADDAEANKLVSGLTRGVFASREAAAIERLLTLATAEPVGSKRAAALVDGMSSTASLTRRPIVFPKEPPVLAALGKSSMNRTALARIEKVLTWPNKPGAEAAAAPLTTEQQVRFETGKTFFQAICSTCHQLTGRGLDGLAPPLLDSEWVLGPPEQVIRIVLHGVRGPIVVGGRTHTGDMPAFGALEDAQLASILTYVRREWGHTASPIDPGQVKAVREQTKGHADAWSPEELRQAAGTSRRQNREPADAP